MALETHIMTEGSSKPQEAAGTRISYLPYFGAAILSGAASVVLGSVICVTFAYALRGDAVGFLEYGIILLMWCMYSGAVVLPVGVLAAFPLMVLFRNTRPFTKLVISTMSGALCALVCAIYIYFYMPGSSFKLIEALGIGTVYGAVFGMVAARLPKRQMEVFPNETAP